MLFTALKLVDCPISTLLLLFVFEELTLNAFRGLIRYASWGTRYWEFNCNSCCEMILWKATSKFDRERKFKWWSLINEGVDSEWGRELPIYTIIHDKELSIWGFIARVLIASKLFKSTYSWQLQSSNTTELMWPVIVRPTYKSLFRTSLEGCFTKMIF
jgi:hypothetical protein